VTAPWQFAENVIARFSEVDPRLLACALGLHVANHALRSVAWRNVLAAAYPESRVPVLGVATAYAVGVALNAVMPARGGDAAKVALVRAGIGGSNIATIVSTMSVVVLFDLVAATVLLLGIAASGTIPFSPHIGNLPLVVGAAALVAVTVVLAGRRLRPALRRLWAAAQQGGAILRAPGRYLRLVAAAQAAAWACRIAVVYLLMAAFGLPATVLGAVTVMVLCGASTLVPLTPGGAGTQQVMVTFALSQAATATAILSFSIGMQAGITAVNACLGAVASMVAFRTLRPVAAVRAGIRLARA
jgi:uncharacterized membrane protein YbhN (UPF0104 family)